MAEAASLPAAGLAERVAAHPRAAPALLDAATGRTWTYGELDDRADGLAHQLVTSPTPLVCCAMAPRPDHVALYLACLRSATPILLAPTSPAAFERVVAAWSPALVIGGEAVHADDAFAAHRRPPADHAPPHPSLALLLTTSGSTGAPKLVRLSGPAVAANAAAIATYLGLDDRERAPTSLPLSYSYGLSVLNSHLWAGAVTVLCAAGPLDRAAHTAWREHGCTSLAGVPFLYETLLRLRFDWSSLPALRTVTQAGGALAPAHITQLRTEVTARGARLFVMYGQTEATARISFVPPERLADKVGSVGLAIPGGRLRLQDGPGSELVYEGPNVMLGYATEPSHLARGDDLGGVLPTGDTARIDADGFVWLEGRLRRFIKLQGRRINLDDVETEVTARCGLEVAAAGTDDRLDVALAGASADVVGAMQRHLAAWLATAPRHVRVIAVPALPRTESGKKDYGRLAAEAPWTS